MHKILYTTDLRRSRARMTAWQADYTKDVGTDLEHLLTQDGPAGTVPVQTQDTH